MRKNLTVAVAFSSASYACFIILYSYLRICETAADEEGTQSKKPTATVAVLLTGSAIHSKGGHFAQFQRIGRRCGSLLLGSTGQRGKGPADEHELRH